MKMFVSWSGSQSKAIAIALKAWLPDVLQQVEVWMSEHDIDAGSRWGYELANILAECHFGVICLTSENREAPWLMFEAGCLAKTAQMARVVPYLHGLTPADVRYPLAQFQGVAATKPGTFRLLQSINDAGGLAIPSDRLEKVFEKWWPDLENTLATVRAGSAAPRPARSERELLEEILGLLRRSQPHTKIPFVGSNNAPGGRVFVDTSDFFENGAQITLQYEPNRSVSKFLDSVFFALNEQGAVPAYEYGTVWLLQNQATGREYDDLGIEYCRTGGRIQDERPIWSVGISAGDRLRVIRGTN